MVLCFVDNFQFWRNKLYFNWIWLDLIQLQSLDVIMDVLSIWIPTNSVNGKYTCQLGELLHFSIKPLTCRVLVSKIVTPGQGVKFLSGRSFIVIVVPVLSKNSTSLDTGHCVKTWSHLILTKSSGSLIKTRYPQDMTQFWFWVPLYRAT